MPKMRKEMIMKKVIALLLSLAMVFALVACSNSTSTSTPSTTPAPSTTTEPSTSTPEPAQPTEPAAPDFPAGKTIKFVCSYSAGGAADLLTRCIADKVSSILGCPTVVEDVTGGSGAVSCNAVLSAGADGYTVLSTASGAITIAPWNADVGYTNESFDGVCQSTAMPLVLTVNPASGITTLDEFIEYARNNSEATTVGAATWGQSQHISMMTLAKALGDTSLFTIVNFDGGAEGRAALLGNQLDASMNVESEVVSYINDGSLIALATTATTRSNFLPDVPTFGELGYPDVNISARYFFAVPAEVDDAVVEILDNAIYSALQDAEVQDQLLKLNFNVNYVDHAALDKALAADTATCGDIINNILK